MSKNFKSLDEVMLPIETLDESLLFIRGGRGVEQKGVGCGCGCDSGAGCGCANGKGCGCGCSAGSGCGCECTEA